MGDKRGNIDPKLIGVCKLLEMLYDEAKRIVAIPIGVILVLLILGWV